MKIKTKSFLSILILFLVFTVNVSAKNNISEIDIDVTVRSDGSAYVVQNIRGVFNEGTENYIPVNTSEISVSDFSVSDINGEYRFISDWDINADFEQKSQKCGINYTADGIELCYGISRYGENTYTVKYTVNDFLKSYTDFDGTNFMFINPNMNTFPTKGHIILRLAGETGFSEENCAVWAFGYEGNVKFENGYIEAVTDGSLNGDDCMIVMFRLDKGIVFPKTETGFSFNEVKNKAFEGSDYVYDEYDEAGILETIIGFFVLFAITALIVWVIVLLAKRKKEIKDFYKNTEYFRDVPNGGNIDVSYYLTRNFDMADEESLVIGALILSMINEKCIEPLFDEKIGFFGKSKTSVNLKLIKEPDKASELKLYRLLSISAGDDGILQEKELETYSYSHPNEITDFINSVKESGETEFIADGGFFGRAGNRIKDLSEKGLSELSEIAGLKKFLEDFTLISEREIKEVSIWKEYMIYAALFGISDTVMKQFEKLYPEKATEITNYNRSVIIANSYCRTMSVYSQKAIREIRINGGGGSSSLGGGGGFSGGGRGGGSR